MRASRKSVGWTGGRRAQGPRSAPVVRICGWGLTVLALWVAPLESGTAAEAPGATQEAAAVFRIGAVFDTTGVLGDFGAAGLRGVEFALREVNAAGGVWGRPVESFPIDGATDPDLTVLRSQVAIDGQGISALVGPMGSAAAVALGEQVAGPHRIPTISPTATSPKLTRLLDDDFLFRTTASDAVQAPVLADLALEEGYSHLGVFFQDDAYGHGLAGALEEAFPGRVTRRAVAPDQETYLPELRQLEDAGAEVLVAITYTKAVAVYLQEALEHQLFDRFLFVDSTASTDWVTLVGAEHVEGMKGTAPTGTLPGLGANLVDSEGNRAFNEAFHEVYGEAPGAGLEAAAYDATICLCLAAEKAGVDDGDAIRDALRQVCGGGGRRLGPTQADSALAAIRAGEKIDYDGVGSTLDWNSKGDLSSGAVLIWQFQEGQVVVLEERPYRLD